MRSFNASLCCVEFSISDFIISINFCAIFFALLTNLLYLLLIKKRRSSDKSFKPNDCFAGVCIATLADELIAALVGKILL